VDAFTSRLRNRYVAMRHGLSIANVADRVVSDPARGIHSYGLTEIGKQQAETSALAAQESGLLDAATLIVSSDFARARQTAEVVSSVLGAAPARLSPALRERAMGSLEGASGHPYQPVWALDAVDPSHHAFGGESVDEVLTRTVGLIALLEAELDGQTVLLVSHGDPLQILQTAFAHVSPAAHRSLPHLENAEIRPLTF
jgi:probable phosphoglycerate mutase